MPDTKQDLLDLQLWARRREAHAGQQAEAAQQDERMGAEFDEQHWHDEERRFAAVRQALEALEKYRTEPTRCNAGHVNHLPITLWDCPACTQLLRDRLANLEVLVDLLKRGGQHGCWCEKAIDNPMYRDHTDLCRRVAAAMAVR